MSTDFQGIGEGVGVGLGELGDGDAEEVGDGEVGAGDGSEVQVWDALGGADVREVGEAVGSEGHHYAGLGFAEQDGVPAAIYRSGDLRAEAAGYGGFG